MARLDQNRASQSEYCGSLESAKKTAARKGFSVQKKQNADENPGLGALYINEMSNQTISLCMIAKNEEKFLEQCLNPVKEIIDEVIIVDTGSTDKTKEIAEKFNAKVIDFKWIDDFSAARNESIKHATKDWILVIDADEIIEKRDLDKIKDAISNADEFVGFQLEQRSYLNNFFEGAVKNDSDFEPIKNYPFYIPNNLVRLFKNKIGISFKHRVHELVEDSINVKKLKYGKIDVVLHHFGSLKDSGLIGEKTEQYAKMILKQLEDEPESARYNYQAAKMFLGRNDYNNALKYFEKTAKLNTNYKLVFSEIAKIYLEMNDKNRAVEYFKKSMKHAPENPSPANNLAVVYMSIGKFKEAEKILDEELKKHPGNEALKYNYGKVLENLGK
ncbi:glycosyltransferase [Candidatus Woesearchaeota archaeon]|nr:glycosyltransferase [Candidatus Woesearchaeota archaeon]